MERNRRNLRGYGLAQAPKFNVDRSGLDDINRQNQYKRNQDAADARQQKALDQRNQEFRAGILSKLNTIKSEWSPTAKAILNEKSKNFYKDANDKSIDQLTIELGRLNSEISAYNTIGDNLAKHAANVAAGKEYASNSARALLGGEMDRAFEGSSLEQILAMGSGIASTQFANMPDMNQFEQMKKRAYDVTKETQEGKLGYVGNVGDTRVEQLEYMVDPAMKQALAEGFIQQNPTYWGLLAQDTGQNPIEYLSSQVSDKVSGKTFTNRPRVEPKEKGFRAAGNGWVDDVYTFTKGAGSTETTNPNAIGELAKQDPSGNTITETVGYDSVTLSRRNRDTPIRSVDFYDDDGELVQGRIREIRKYPSGYKEIVIADRKYGDTRVLPYNKNKEVLLGEYNLSDQRIDLMFSDKSNSTESEKVDNNPAGLEL